MKNSPSPNRVADQFRRIALIVVCAFGLIHAAAAQAPHASDNHQESKVTPESALEALQRIASGTGAVVVNQFNLAELSPLLTPELQNLVAVGALQFQAIPALGAEFPQSKDILGESQNVLQLNAQGGLRAEAVLTQGLPFAAAGTLDLDAAQRLLWNTYAAQWNFGMWRFALSIAHVLSNRAEGVLSAELTRVYPQVVKPADARPQLFRELLSFSKPDFISKYAWLTFRLLENEPDYVWVFSPSLKRVRQLTGSNRSDALFKYSVSPDDLGVWSGNPALVQATSISAQQLLVPLASRVPLPLVSANGCQSTQALSSSQNLEQLAAWNYQIVRFPQAAGWVPTQAIWVPRAVYKLELASRDPFALYGRQELYIDRDLMLPIFKVVFDRAGRRWKNIFGALAVSQSADRNSSRAFVPYVVSLDLVRNLADVIEVSRVETCAAYPSGLKLADFDPSKLAPEDEHQGSKAAPAAAETQDQSKLETED